MKPGRLNQYLSADTVQQYGPAYDHQVLECEDITYQDRA